jgi:hypothetical protein
MQDAVMTQLDLAEQQFNQVAAFLACGDAPQMEVACQSLQALSLQLAKLLQAPASPAAKKAVNQRVRALAQQLQMLRDNTFRRAAYTEQALSIVVPTPAKSTYSGGSSVYGSVARQSGQFKVLAA